MKFEGIFPPAITPFTKDEEINEEKLLEYLDFLIKHGIHGLFMLGTNGEGPLLTFEEKKRVIKIAVEHVNGKIPIIAGTGCVSTKETIELSKYAEKVGADAVHVVTPYYYPVSQQGLIKHYTKIAESIELPIIIYYIPDRTGVKIDVSTLIKLAEVPNIIGIKDSSKDVGWFYNAVMNVREKRPDFLFFGGSDALIYTHLTLGKELQDKVLRIRQALKSGPYMAGVKGALKLRGMDFGELRSPLQSLSEEELKRLEDNLRKINIL